MAKSKGVIKLILACLFFYSCSSRFHRIYISQNKYIGMYCYKSPARTTEIGIELKPDSTFKFKLYSGLSRRYSKGEYLVLENGKIFLHTIYEKKDGYLVDFGFMILKDTIEMKYNKLIYKGRELIRCNVPPYLGDIKPYF